MAEGFTYACGKCGHRVSTWSDGNPYYLDENGAKHYAYHPDHDRLALCIGNDSPHLCLACGAEFKVDSRAPIQACPDCGSGEIVDTYHLKGRRCSSCREGVFEVDPNSRCIS